MRIEFTNESLSSNSVSISFLSIWWTAFHKIEIDSNETFARADDLVSAASRDERCGTPLTTDDTDFSDPSKSPTQYD